MNIRDLVQEALATPELEEVMEACDDRVARLHPTPR